MEQRQPPRSTRAALLTLFFGNFVIGTGTMIVVGMLNLIAGDLEVSLAAAGQLVAGYGLACCFGAPVLASITSHLDRRTLLVGALVLFAAGHLLAAAAPNYLVLMALRVLTGFGAAVFTPQAAATAGLLAAPEQRGRAVAMVFLGWSIASVLGNPIGIYLGATFGWRTSFAIIGVLTAACALLLRTQLSGELRVQRMDRAAWGEVGRDTALLLVLATTILQATGQYTLSVYFTAVFEEYLSATPTLIALLFGWFGLCGVIGNVTAGMFVDRLGAARVVTVTMGLMLAAMLLWPLTRGSLGFALFAVALWGLGSFATNSTQQARLIGLSPRLAPVSVALNSSGFYLGNAAGAVIGALVLTSIDMSALSWVGAGILLVALGSSFGAQFRLAAQRAAAVAPVADESR